MIYSRGKVLEKTYLCKNFTDRISIRNFETPAAAVSKAVVPRSTLLVCRSNSIFWHYIDWLILREFYILLFSREDKVSIRTRDKPFILIQTKGLALNMDVKWIATHKAVQNKNQRTVITSLLSKQPFSTFYWYNTTK